MTHFLPILFYYMLSEIIRQHIFFKLKNILEEQGVAVN